MSIHQDAQTIIRQALKACLPDQAVRRALEQKDFAPGQRYLVAAGTAAWAGALLPLLPRLTRAQSRRPPDEPRKLA